MEWTGILVVWLSAVNFGFWSRLGCSGQNAIIFSHQDLVKGCTRRNNKTKQTKGYTNCCILTVRSNHDMSSARSALRAIQDGGHGNIKQALWPIFGSR